MNRSVTFRALVMSYKPHLYSFVTLKRTPKPRTASPYSTCLRSALLTITCSLSLWTGLFWTFSVNRVTQEVGLPANSLRLADRWDSSPRMVSTLFLLLPGWRPVPAAATLCPLSHHGHFCCLHPLALVKGAARNRSTQQLTTH